MMALKLHHGICVDVLIDGNKVIPVDIEAAKIALLQNGYKRIKQEFIDQHLVETWDKNENLRSVPIVVPN